MSLGSIMVKGKKTNWWMIGFIMLIIPIILSLFGQNNTSQDSDTKGTTQDYDIKGTYQYTYSGNYDKTYLDKPNSLVFIVLSGSYNELTISSQTEVSSITLSGTNNNIIFCNGGYPTPRFVKSGVNNQVSYGDC